MADGVPYVSVDDGCRSTLPELQSPLARPQMREGQVGALFAR
jgi:hypothetical protein